MIVGDNMGLFDKFKNILKPKTEEYKVVGRMEADLAAGKVSFDSPLGQAIMKKEAGTTATVAAPAGEYQVTIVEVK